MNHTVRAALAEGIRALADAKVGRSQITAQLLMAHVLGWDRVRVLSHGTNRSRGPREQFRALVRRSAAASLAVPDGRARILRLYFLVTRPSSSPSGDGNPGRATLWLAGRVAERPVAVPGSGHRVRMYCGHTGQAATMRGRVRRGHLSAAIAVAGINARRHAVSGRVRS